MIDLWLYERDYRAKGYTLIAGVDEAGRGPLAGPVFAAAVILPYDHMIEGLNDSKKLSPQKRDRLYDMIVREALTFSVTSSDHLTIDRINILQASLLAMTHAVKHLAITPDLVLIDGNQKPLLPVSAECIVKGDAKSANIAAASILAKVSRDRFMEQMDLKYPQYHFAKHKGYPTKEHYDLLLKYGPCEIHRKSFLTKMDGLKWTENEREA
ncbi:Ribonuclease HII [bioreactor metagenome]|uniref:Ribonuclease HII n=1 Tax=bioreactor metagenome TaxID=1076179 RepID=A0A645ABD7_9ZZZZ